ncbi:MAG: hypothetical protein AAGC46_18825 [Solirubrobacteraceae bacterium]|nr:hypothetical protein [Patulibacter sp.]
MPTSARLLTAAILSAALLAVPQGASASGEDVLRDCIAGQLKTHYPAADYAAALASMPADAAEYSPCIAQITAARDRDLAQTARAIAGSRPTTSSLGGSGTGATTAAGAAAPLASTAARATPPSTTPLHPTTPQRDATTEPDPNAGLALLAAGPGDDDPNGSSGNGLPAIPIVLAFSVIALSAARALKAWGERPESPSDDAAAPAA